MGDSKNSIPTIIKEISKKLIEFKNKLWFKYIIKKNEFHPSLDLNYRKMMGKDKKAINEYLTKMMKKREIAHNLSEEENNGK